MQTSTDSYDNAIKSYIYVCVSVYKCDKPLDHSFSIASTQEYNKNIKLTWDLC